MNGYYLFWATLIAVSLWVSIGAFLWAHRHGQFKDQERARFIALRDEAQSLRRPNDGGARHQVFVMVGILAVGISGILAVLFMVIFGAAGGRI